MIPAATATRTTKSLSTSTSGEISKRKKHEQSQRAPSIEVVNEIQIIANKRDNARSLNVTSTPSDNKDLKKCVSSRSSKTDLTALTTPTLDNNGDNNAMKNATADKNSRRSSKNSSEKDKSETSSTICMCGKLLKRVKELLQHKETKAKSE